MNQSINTCVIGHNYAKKILDEILKKNKQIDIKAVSVKNKKKTNIKFKLFYSWKKMIDVCSPQLVIIATPPIEQSNIIKYLLKKKISFFAQKPLSYNIKDAQKIFYLIKKSKNIKTAIDLNFLELKPIIAFKKNISKNPPLKNTEVNIHWLFNAKKHKDNNWKNKKKSGGGKYYNFGFHLFSVIIHLFGDIKVVSAKKNSMFDLIEIQTKKKIKIKVFFSNIYKKKNLFSIKYKGADGFSYKLLNTSKNYHGNFSILKNTKKIFSESKSDRNTNIRVIASTRILNKLIDSINLKQKFNNNHYNLATSLKVHVIISDIYKFIK